MLRKPKIYAFFFQTQWIGPLVHFRIFLGLVLIWAAFYSYVLQDDVQGRFTDLTFRFHYWGLSWLPWPQVWGLHLLYLGWFLGALGMVLGWYFRYAVFLFLFCFIWIQALDATNYINHYYLLILLAFLLGFSPAHRAYSFDVWQARESELSQVPRLYLDLIKFQLIAVYFFAGLAKLNPDWLFKSLPLGIWFKQLSTQYGAYLAWPYVAAWASWLGAAFDLSIGFALFFLRGWYFALAYLSLILFHGLTGYLLDIGLFPLIMVVSTSIFWPETWHRLGAFWSRGTGGLGSGPSSGSLALATVYVFVQLYLPLRAYWAHEGPLQWTERAYRWSWRLMLQEKEGWAVFWLVDLPSGRTWEVNPKDYLTGYQIKRMLGQEYHLKQFAEFLAKDWSKRYELKDLAVYAEVHLAWNTRPARLLFRKDCNLLGAEDCFNPWWRTTAVW